MCRHLLRKLQRTAIGQIRRDPCRPKAVTSDLRSDPSHSRPLADHPQSIRLRHGLLRQHRAGVPTQGAEQRVPTVLGYPGGLDVGLQYLGQCMMIRPGVMLATYPVQLQLPAGTLMSEILTPSSSAPPRPAQSNV